MIEGIIYGVVGSVMSVVMVTIGVFYAAPYVKIFVPDINGWAYYLSNFFMFMSAQIFFGVGLGVVSSYIAVRKYLKI